LCNKYTSLKEDFDTFKDVLQVEPTWDSPKFIVKVAWLWEDIHIWTYKCIKFPLTCMKKANSWIRIVYMYDPKWGTVEFVEFVEIYHKNKQVNHDTKLIRKLYKNIDTLPSPHGEEELE